LKLSDYSIYVKHASFTVYMSPWMLTEAELSEKEELIAEVIEQPAEGEVTSQPTVAPPVCQFYTIQITNNNVSKKPYFRKEIM